MKFDRNRNHAPLKLLGNVLQLPGCTVEFFSDRELNKPSVSN